MYGFLPVFPNVVTFESRFIIPLILLVLTLLKKVLWETLRKTVPNFLVSLCKNTTVLKMKILTLGNYKSDNNLMILQLIFSILGYRMNLVNVTFNLFSSLVRFAVLLFLLLLTPMSILPLKIMKSSAKTMTLLWIARFKHIKSISYIWSS